MISYVLIAFLFSLSLAAGEVCPKCEKIREYNKEHPGEYEFYEDYLKDKEKEKKSTK